MKNKTNLVNAIVARHDCVLAPMKGNRVYALFVNVMDEIYGTDLSNEHYCDRNRLMEMGEDKLEFALQYLNGMELLEEDIRMWNELNNDLSDKSDEEVKSILREFFIEPKNQSLMAEAMYERHGDFIDGISD